jgi:hypothetical protein
MRKNNLLALLAVALAATPLFLEGEDRTDRVIRVTDTVYVKQALDYDELARRVAARLEKSAAEPTVIEGDLIVKGRLGVGGAPEPGTPYGITVRGQDDASIGTIGVAQDGGLRMDQNSTCLTDNRGCTVDDRRRRRAYSGFDSMGDMSFYLSDVDSTSGAETAPRAQSLVFRLLDWDGNIHIHAHRPGQRIFFNASTAIHAADLQWEVPFK